MRRQRGGKNVAIGAKTDAKGAGTPEKAPVRATSRLNGAVPLRDAPLVPAVAVLVLSTVFATYASTLYPYVSGGDAGELLVATHNLGVAHPPGYPLFTVLGHASGRLLGAWLPSTSWAWRVNVMSSLLGSCAAMFLYLAVARATRSAWPGLVAALGFAFSPTVWWYAIQGEVFGLNNFLLALVLYLTVLYDDVCQEHAQGSGRGAGGPKQLAVLGAFVCGLALCNQHTSVFPVFVTCLGVVVSLYRSGWLDTSLVVQLCAAMLAGVAPYAYMPWAAARKPMDSWGDQRTLAGFLHHFFRREYGTFQLAADVAPEDNPGMAVRLGVYWDVLLAESLYVLPAFAVVGFAAWLMPSRTGASRGAGLWQGLTSHYFGSRLKASGVILCVSYVLYMAVFHYLANLDPTNPLFLGVQARFWQQANMYVFVWAALGVFVCWKLVLGGNGGGDGGEQGWHRAVLCIVCVAIAAAQLATHYRSRDFSDMKGFRASGEAALESFPAHSIVLVNGDLNNNVIKYPQQCENVRPDLNIISVQLMSWDWFVPMQRHHFPDVEFPGERYHPHIPGGFSMAQFIQANTPRREVYLCGPWKEGDTSTDNLYDKVPYGACDRVMPKGQRPAELAAFLRRGLRAIPTAEQLGPWQPHKYSRDSWEYVLYQDNWVRQAYFTSYIAFHSNQNPEDRKLLRLARDANLRLFQDEALVTLWLERRILEPVAFRDAGIIYGQWAAKVLAKQPAEHDKYSRLMLEAWTRYCDLLAGDGSADDQIQALVDRQLNPYSGRRVES